MIMAKPVYDPADDRGIFSFLAAMAQAALSTPARLDRRPATPPRPGLLERFDRWAARARQRDRERYLATSRDVFELEQRIRAAERMPYFF